VSPGGITDQERFAAAPYAEAARRDKARKLRASPGGLDLDPEERALIETQIHHELVKMREMDEEILEAEAIQRRRHGIEEEQSERWSLVTAEHPHLQGSVRSPSPVSRGGYPANPLYNASLYVTAARALESAKPPSERLVADPWAESFATGHGMGFLSSVASSIGSSVAKLSDFEAVRTRYVDDFILGSIARDPSLTQIVILAAGSDTRSRRLNLPSPNTGPNTNPNPNPNWRRLNLPSHVTVYEVDAADVIQHRAYLLKGAPTVSGCRVRSLASDIYNEEWDAPLIQAGFNKRAKSLWVLESLLMYLDQQHVQDTLAKVSSLSASSSLVVGDLLNEADANPNSNPKTLTLTLIPTLMIGISRYGFLPRALHRMGALGPASSLRLVLP